MKSQGTNCEHSLTFRRDGGSIQGATFSVCRIPVKPALHPPRRDRGKRVHQSGGNMRTGGRARKLCQSVIHSAAKNCVHFLIVSHCSAPHISIVYLNQVHIAHDIMYFF